LHIHRRRRSTFTSSDGRRQRSEGARSILISRRVCCDWLKPRRSSAISPKEAFNR
jgi:hypothetical protein